MSYPFENMPVSAPLLLKGDPSIEHYSQDTMMQATPDAVLRARDVQEIKEVLQYCNAEKIPVTFCGSQTSMTGASVAGEGLLVSTEKLEKIHDIGTLYGCHYATAEPGIIISDLKKKAAEEGFFYPPSPTSQDNARLGATVSTNATGKDSLKYGTTRKYIREIKVLLADGSEKIFSRTPEEPIPDALNRAGYFTSSNNPLDWFIGGEGTLGFIYEVTVDLIPKPLHFFSGLAPFPDFFSAIDFVVSCVTEGKMSPRALELIDNEALSYMKTHPSFPQGLKEAHTLIYFKQEYKDEADFERVLSLWLPKLAEETLIATADKQQEEMRLWRHHIPSSLNEHWRKFWNRGGGKIGSDWWVPIKKLKEMMQYVQKTGKELGLPYMTYAHVGMGHPHVNYLCKNGEEKCRAEAVLLQCCRKAVTFGGGVCGEHGLGKLHRNLLPIQCTKNEIGRMQAIKKEFDPNWILGRGNMLEFI
ncbi:MAG: FAD-binding oxidoreductase [Deltaproteobacteria bacterium]|nr:FAD-binding oxidoreductase [Deltaproteobacteria bacterium]